MAWDDKFTKDDFRISMGFFPMTTCELVKAPTHTQNTEREALTYTMLNNNNVKQVSSIRCSAL